MTAAVGRIGAALDKAAAVELVEQRHEAAGNHAQPAGERLLGKPGGAGHDIEDAGMGRLEAQPGEAFGEPAGRVAA